MAEDKVEDKERLYRAVSNSPQNFPRDPNGNVRLSSQAFNDREMRPSVDRAHLKGFDPSQTQMAPTDGVVSKLASEVRTVQATLNDAKGVPVKNFVADVEPVPLPENVAHAEIYGKPNFDNTKVFRRILEQLTRDIVWEIQPAELRHPD